MKLLVLVLSLVSAAASAQYVTDPFDKDSCLGTMITPEKVVTLLGDKEVVNLARVATGNQEDSTPGYYRWRNVINKIPGSWNSGGYWKMSPLVINNAGKTEFAMDVRGPYSDTSERVTCAVYKNQRIATHTCVPAKGSQILKDWASGGFYANLTDRCMRLWQQRSTPGKDEQWVYLLQF